MPAQKQSPTVNSPISSNDESILSFIPVGMLRSIVEYLAAVIPGAILLFAFFSAAVLPRWLMPTEGILAVVFIPVICIVPILSGAVSTLVLEKLRKKPLTIQRGAMVGAAAGLVGALVSTIPLIAVNLLTTQSPFGDPIKGPFFYVALLAILAIDTVLGALGGAAVVKFIKQAE